MGRKLILSLFVFVVVMLPVSVFAQTTEHFSDETDNTTSFSHSGLSFSIGGSYLHIENYSSYGYTGSANDDHYVDNSDNLMGSAGVIGSFTNSGSDFYVHNFYILPSDDGVYQSNDGTVTIRGKLNSSTEFTHTVQSGEINMSSPNNYYTYVNLSSYSTTRIDELEFETTGGIIYLAIDAFQHSAASGNAAPTASSFTASPIYQGTVFPFATANFSYSDADADPFDHLRVTAIPGAGTLWVDSDGSGTVNGAESTLSNNGTISKSNLDAGYLKYLNTNGTSSSFTFDVNDGTDYSASTYTATLTVTPEPTVTLSLDPLSSVSENGGTTSVKATLSHTFDKTVTTNLVFSGTASGADYTVTATPITIASGNTENTVTITGEDDALDENDETIIVDISSVTNGSESGTQQVTCTLTDDDNPPTVTFTTVSQSSASETGAMTITAQLSGTSGKNVTIPFSVNGSSTATGPARIIQYLQAQ